jgi:acyl-CoA synthetase (AMP-forming)/AMP-acid ligase II
MKLADYLDRGVFINPEGVCFITEGEEMTYTQVQELTYRIANGLLDAGMGKDSHIAILSPNDPRAFSCVLGLSRTGATWVPINPRNGLEENHYILDAFDCNVLFYHSNYAELVHELRPRLPKIQLYVCLDQEDEGAPAFDDWAASFPPTPVDVISRGDDMAMLAGTGGTTGKPKGVMLTNQNLETFIALTLLSAPHNDETPVYLALAPLTHAAGVLTFPILALGGATVIMPKADLSKFLHHIETYRVTTTFLPPTVIYMLLEHPEVHEIDYASLKYFWYGAAPISAVKLKQAIETFGPVMTQFYGQTEAPMLITYLSPQEHFAEDGGYAEQRLRSCGRPTPLVRVGIMDDDGDFLPAGQRGEIVVQGSLVMPGYYKNKDATASAFSDGWLRTGDVGYFDDEGYLYLVDRKKDLIITGGFNVFSAEVEQAVLQHPSVQDCAVVGLPHEKWGEMVVAVVQLREGYELDEMAIIKFCKERIGSVKSPKRVFAMPDLPRSAVGKVLKRDIRQQLSGVAEAFLRD